MARGRDKQQENAANGARQRASKGERGSSRAKNAPKRASVSSKKSRLFNTPAIILAPRLMFIVSVVALCTFGFIMIYSASSIEAFTDPDLNNNPSYFLQRQAISLAVAVVACVVCAFIPYRFWANKWVAWIAWAIAVGFLVAVCFKGDDKLGATRSLNLGFFELQPSEFAKIAILILNASLVERISNGELKLVPDGLVQIVVSIVLMLVFIFKQPDLGTAMILIVGLLALFLLCGAPWKIVWWLIAAALLYFVVVCIIQPYHIERIVTVFNPDAVAQDEGYQSVQGFLALGNGGFFGTGLGLSRQKYDYLTYAYNDFIFAVVGEELGFFGAAVIILLFGLFIFAGLRISHTAPDLFSAALSGSLTTMVGFQACLNIACVLGVAPVTGKALPFISYGGSSLLATMIICGLILGISRGSSIDAQNERRRDNLLVVDGGASRGAQGRPGAAGQQGMPSLGGILSGVGSALSEAGSKLGNRASADSRQSGASQAPRTSRGARATQRSGSSSAASDRAPGRTERSANGRSGNRSAASGSQAAGTRRRSSRSRDMELDLVDIVPKSGRRSASGGDARSASRPASRPRSSSASHGRTSRGARRPGSGYGSDLHRR